MVGKLKQVDNVALAASALGLFRPILGIGYDGLAVAEVGLRRRVIASDANMVPLNHIEAPKHEHKQRALLWIESTLHMLCFGIFIFGDHSKQCAHHELF